MNRLIRLPEVLDRTGLKKTALYKYMGEGKFPNKVKLGKAIKPLPPHPKNSQKKLDSCAVAWVESEITEWVDDRIKERNIKSIYNIGEKNG